MIVEQGLLVSNKINIIQTTKIKEVNYVVVRVTL